MLCLGPGWRAPSPHPRACAAYRLVPCAARAHVSKAGNRLRGPGGGGAPSPLTLRSGLYPKGIPTPQHQPLPTVPTETATYGLGNRTEIWTRPVDVGGQTHCQGAGTRC